MENMACGILADANKELTNAAIEQLREKWNARAPQRLEEFQALVTPLVDWLRENYDPHTEIRVGWDKAEIFCIDMGVPFPYED